MRTQELTNMLVPLLKVRQTAARRHETQHEVEGAVLIEACAQWATLQALADYVHEWLPEGITKALAPHIDDYRENVAISVREMEDAAVFFGELRKDDEPVRDRIREALLRRKS
jgi:hypothetical protein